MIKYLYTLRIHLIILFWAGPVQASITLFADQKVWKVHLLKFQLDRFQEFLSDPFSRFAAYNKTIRWALTTNVKYLTP